MAEVWLQSNFGILGNRRDRRFNGSQVISDKTHCVVSAIAKGLALARSASTQTHHLLPRGNGKGISKVIDHFDGHLDDQGTVFPAANTHQ